MAPGATGIGGAFLPVEDEEGVGRFAWIVDPEGNRVELWEPVEGK